MSIWQSNSEHWPHAKAIIFFMIVVVIVGVTFLIVRDNSQPVITTPPVAATVVPTQPSAPPPQVALPIKTKPTTDFRICVEGDNNLATLAEFVDRNENVYGYASHVLAACDLTVANLETNISAPGIGTPQEKGYTYNAPLAAINTLQKGGIDVVTLANNHSMDFGPAALVDEMTRLTTVGIAYFGAGANLVQAFMPTYLVTHDTKLAFIGINDIENWITDAKENSAGSAYFDETRLLNAVSTARENADVVIVYAHWGDENSEVVTSRQQYFAHKIIDAGADIMIGTGPHLRQMHETYSGKPVYYSIGNFAVQGFFGWPERSKGDLLQLDLSDKHITTTSTTEITIDFLGWPNEPGQDHGAK